MENEKVFQGGKPVVLELHRLLERLTTIKNNIELSDKEPDIYMKEQLFEDELEAEFVLNNTYASYGDNALETFQIDFIHKVLNVLKITLPTNDLSFEILKNETGYYYIQVTAYFLEENVPILNIYPYFKKYEIIENEKLKELRLLEQDTLNEVNEYKDRINLIKESFKNPALYANGDVKLYLQLANKKKRDEILSTDLMQTNANLQIVNEHLMNIRDEINELSGILNSIDITINRYTERLRNRYKYTTIENFNPEDGETNNNLFHNSLENNVNKGFFENMIQDNTVKDNEQLEIHFF